MQTNLLSSSEPTRPSDRVSVQVAAGVFHVKTLLVNLYFIQDLDGPDWIICDAGLALHGAKIIAAAQQRFGAARPPSAVVLTHGHFDHVGSLRSVLPRWDVPIYAHPMELPYVTGRAAYPPADPTVGGGMMARTSKLLPRGPYDFRPNVRELPRDGSVPHVRGWRWIATPGHSPGHVSLWRESDRVLVAGDAFVTQRQESLVGVVTAAPELRGPPMYFTHDWEQAGESVRRLAALEPSAALTGHGRAMFGEELRAGLWDLA